MHKRISEAEPLIDAGKTKGHIWLGDKKYTTNLKEFTEDKLKTIKEAQQLIENYRIGLIRCEQLIKNPTDCLPTHAVEAISDTILEEINSSIDAVDKLANDLSRDLFLTYIKYLYSNFADSSTVNLVIKLKELNQQLKGMQHWNYQSLVTTFEEYLACVASMQKNSAKFNLETSLKALEEKIKILVTNIKALP
ncbi:MAG: hypothetical protein K2X94_03510 [Amoebophilaceae bacterium]|nr:hypothetical protein [Amoebophilaceae bacterium]